MRVRIIFIAAALYCLHQTLYVKTLESNNYVKGSVIVELASGMYYIEPKKTLNWYGAQHFCRSIGAHLVSIETDAEMQEITKYLTDNGFVNKKNFHWSGEEWFWIGCNDIDNEGNFTWIGTGKPMEYTRWAENQPDNAFSDENCAALWRHSKDITWNDRNCKGVSRYICKFHYKPVEFSAFEEN